MFHTHQKPLAKHKGQHNMLTMSEVVLVIVEQEFEKWDIFLHSEDDQFVWISETHRAYDALQYPLMF